MCMERSDEAEDWLDTSANILARVPLSFSFAFHIRIFKTIILVLQRINKGYLLKSLFIKY